MKAIESNGLVRKFGDLVAVGGVSFEVDQGEIFGFLGPNGAGKTTTINMLCTLLRPTAGTATVNGYDVARQPDEVRQSIGLVFQDPSLDDQLTAMENLRFHALLYDVPRDVFQRRASEVLELADLTGRADSLVQTFSGGMKRRLEIARGLLHHPRVLFLDEPTLGLDPQTRRHIWEYVLALREREGVTIFLTTHYMDEAEHADRIAIIDHGKIVALDTPEALKGMVGGDVIRLRTSNDELATLRLQEALATEVRHDGQALILEVPQGDRAIPQVIQVLADGSGPAVDVLSINLRRPTLEDVFIKLTGRAIRDEEGDAKDRMRLHSRMWRRQRR
ncbi:MAG: ATP-binding cassette domain-containing protein [Anaerolineae bacterium]